MKEKNYYAALTGIRAIAAYLVFFHHFNPFTPTNSFLHKVCAQGNIGVDLFFILSGFLIAERYQDSFSLKRDYIIQYVGNRIARIYPMYFLLTAATFLLAPVAFGQLRFWKPYFTTEIFLYNITFLKGFFDAFLFTGVMQGWSLTVEEVFYLLAAPMIFLIRIPYRYVLWTIIFLASGYGLMTLSKTLHWGSFLNTPNLVFNYTFFGSCFEFIAGIWLSNFMKKVSISGIKNQATYLGLIGIALVMICLAMIPEKDHYTFVWGRTLLSHFILPIPIICLIYGLIKENTWLSRLLSGKTFDLLGKSSYTFYLLHLGAIQVILFKWLKPYNCDNAFVLLPIMIFLSILLFRFVEEPLNHLIRSGVGRLLKKKS